MCKNTWSHFVCTQIKVMSLAVSRSIKLKNIMSYGYCDLCINSPNADKDKLRQILYKLCDYGYETIALNQIIDEGIFESDKTKKKKKSNENKQVPTIPEPMEVQDLIQEFKGRLNILSRLTFSFTNPAKTYTLGQSSILKKYNLYAVIPKSQAALQFACSQLNVDILYMDPLSNEARLNRKLYLQAVKRGVHFEIQYVNAINVNTRKFMLHLSHLFYTYGKSKNVVVSSGADDLFFVRNPYDVIHLGAIFGLNGIKSQASILLQCHHLLYKAERRIFGKSAFSIQFKEKDDRGSEGKKIKL